MFWGITPSVSCQRMAREVGRDLVRQGHDTRAEACHDGDAEPHNGGGEYDPVDSDRTVFFGNELVEQLSHYLSPFRRTGLSFCYLAPEMWREIEYSLSETVPFRGFVEG